MDENVKVIFEGIKNALGESSSVITDRTIEQTIQEFSDFAPQENAEVFWNEKIVTHLKNTVAGQVRAFASDKKKEWETIKQQEIERIKKELEEGKVSKQEIEPVPSPEKPITVEIPDEVKKQLEELAQFKKDLELKAQKEKEMQIISEKRKKIASLLERPEAGMPNKLLREIIFDNISIDPTEDDTNILLKIQGKYNESSVKYAKDGINPYLPEMGKSNDVKSFIERRKEAEKVNRENNVVSKYYSKFKK